MTGIVKKDVLGLEVTVDDLESMQTLERTQQLRSIESSAVDVEALLSLQMVEQFPAVHKCQNKVKLFGRLERELQGNDERIVDLGQHRSLGESMCDFGSRDDVSLSDGLEGVDSASILLHDLHDFTKTTLAHDLQQVEILHLEAALPVLDERDADLDRASSELEIQPLSTQLTQVTLLLGMSSRCLLVVFLAQLRVFDKWLSLLEARLHLDRTQENILAPTGTSPGSWVAQVQLYIQFGLPRNIEFECCVVTRPKGILRGTRDGIDKDLVLFEIQEGVGEVLGRIATVDGRSSIDTATCGLWPAGLCEGSSLSMGRV